MSASNKSILFVCVKSCGSELFAGILLCGVGFFIRILPGSGKFLVCIQPESCVKRCIFSICIFFNYNILGVRNFCKRKNLFVCVLPNRGVLGILILFVSHM